MLSYAQLWTIVNSWGLNYRKTRLRNLCLLVSGILASRSGSLSAIVRTWSGPRRHIHRLKRLHRFLKNSAVDIAEGFRVIAPVVWRHIPGGQRTRFVPLAVDWTKVRNFHTLWAAMPCRKRALPVAFGVYHAQRLRHSQNKLEQGLFTLAASLVPADRQVLFLADAGFGYTALMQWMQHMGFDFVVRLRAETYITYRGQTKPLKAFDTLEGAPILLSKVAYRQDDPVTINLVISRLGDKVWYLGTSLQDAEQTVAWYKKRFWIEEMFRDFKSRLGLRQAWLTHEDRLARLLLGFQLAYIVLCLVGLHVPNRWKHYLTSRDKASFFWLALHALPFFTRPRHRPIWFRHIWPNLISQTG